MQAKRAVQAVLPGDTPVLELSDRTSAPAARRFPLVRARAHTMFSEVWPFAFSFENTGSLKNVIAWCAAAIAPFSLDIVGDVVGADLLAMAINAAVCCVNVLAAL
jgi:hypothetical protein